MFLCVCVTKLDVTKLCVCVTILYLTKLCVTMLCVTMLYVTKLCVCDAEEEEAPRHAGGRRSKNKNATQFCGEPSTTIQSQDMVYSFYSMSLFFPLWDAQLEIMLNFRSKFR